MRIAVIGTGYGERHIEAFNALPDVEVAAVVSGSPGRANATAERHGVPFGTTDYREALDVDAVCIAAPPDLHREIALAAFERGCHVLCEKPLAPSTADCEAMLDAAERSGLVHAVNYDWRYVPQLARLHDLVADAWIGDVENVHVAWLAPWEADPGDPFTWRHELARCGAGVLGDQSHLFDDLLWNLGPLTRVCADLQVVVPERRDRSGVTRRCDAEDTAAFAAVTAGGVQVTGQCSRCTTGGQRVARYQGSRGTLTFAMSDPSDRDSATLVGQRPGEPPADLSPERTAAAETAQGLFVSAIRDGAPLATSFAAGLAVVRLTDALRESSDEGRWVGLAPN
jgi:predicted dehydrogenase